MLTMMLYHGILLVGGCDVTKSQAEAQLERLY